MKGLTDEEEKDYQAWLQKIGMTKENGMAMTKDGTGLDYNMRAFYKKYGPVDVNVAGGQHFTDEFKESNHPTFNRESIYSTPQNPGGQWQQAGSISPVQPNVPGLNMPQAYGNFAPSQSQLTGYAMGGNQPEPNHLSPGMVALIGALAGGNNAFQK